MEMIVGLKYDSEGKRHIATINYNCIYSREEIKEVARKRLAFCDEVYIIDINSGYQPLIDEIVLKGCRIGV